MGNSGSGAILPIRGPKAPHSFPRSQQPPGACPSPGVLFRPDGAVWVFPTCLLHFSASLRVPFISRFLTFLRCPSQAGQAARPGITRMRSLVRLVRNSNTDPHATLQGHHVLYPDSHDKAGSRMTPPLPTPLSRPLFYPRLR